MIYPLVSSETRRGTACAVDCRERLAEAENALPLGFVEGSFALGNGAASQTQRIGMLGGERSEIFLKRFPFYTVKIMFEIFRRFSVSFVTSFS